MGCMAPSMAPKKIPPLIWYIQGVREFIIYQDDDEQWVAEAKDLPGYRATGKTQEEALEKIKSVLLIYHPCRCED